MLNVIRVIVVASLSYLKVINAPLEIGDTIFKLKNRILQNFYFCKIF